MYFQLMVFGWTFPGIDFQVDAIMFVKYYTFRFKQLALVDTASTRAETDFAL